MHHITLSAAAAIERCTGTGTGATIVKILIIVINCNKGTGSTHDQFHTFTLLHEPDDMPKLPVGCRMGASDPRSTPMNPSFM